LEKIEYPHWMDAARQIFFELPTREERGSRGGKELFPLHPRRLGFKKTPRSRTACGRLRERVKPSRYKNHRQGKEDVEILAQKRGLVKFFTNSACVSFDAKNKVAALTHI